MVSKIMIKPLFTFSSKQHLCLTSATSTFFPLKNWGMLEIEPGAAGMEAIMLTIVLCCPPLMHNSPNFLFSGRDAWAHQPARPRVLGARPQNLFPQQDGGQPGADDRGANHQVRKCRFHFPSYNFLPHPYHYYIIFLNFYWVTSRCCWRGLSN